MPGRSRDDGQQSSELWGAQPAYGQDGVDVSSDRKRLRYCNPITKESEQRCRADPGTTDSSRASSGGRNPLMGKMGWTCLQIGRGCVIVIRSQRNPNSDAGQIQGRRTAVERALGGATRLWARWGGRAFSPSKTQLGLVSFPG